MQAQVSVRARADIARQPRFSGIRSIRVDSPFKVHLIFYRDETSVLRVVRVIHSARDLPRHLREVSPIYGEISTPALAAPAVEVLPK